MTSQPYRAAVRTMLRDRLLDAAEAAFADDGWRKLTMAKVADRAGVSRHHPGRVTPIGQVKRNMSMGC